MLRAHNGKQVRYSGDSHFFVNGPSRAGKGRGFVMTNLLELTGSAIVLDGKKENFNLTGAARLASRQNVFLFSLYPARKRATAGIPSISSGLGRHGPRI